MSEKPKRQSWTFRSQRRFWLREDISLPAKGVCHILLSYANAEGFAWPTTPQIAAAGGISEVFADKLLCELRDRECLSWHIWKDEFGHRRRRFDLSPVHIKPTGWDGLGGNNHDGRRTLTDQH